MKTDFTANTFDSFGMNQQNKSIRNLQPSKKELCEELVNARQLYQFVDINVQRVSKNYNQLTKINHVNVAFKYWHRC